MNPLLFSTAVVFCANKHVRAAGLVLSAIFGLAGCVTETVRAIDLRPPDQFEGVQGEADLLDIGVLPLDANVPEDYDERIEQIISPDIRAAESWYVAYLTKNLLQSTGNWGAVRVIPRATNAVDLQVSGKILSSTGEELAVEFSVTDATGQPWFSQTYRHLASKYGYEDGLPPGVDAFQGLYKAFADDLLEYRLDLNSERVGVIRATAEMKFAEDFAPDAFAGAITENEGRFLLQRLPAENDPVLGQVRKVREREYLFIDTLDEYYANYYRQMLPIYDQWRKTSYNDAITFKRLQDQARKRLIAGTVSIATSVAAIYESDSPYVDASGVAGVGAGAALIVNSLQKSQEAAQYADKLREIGNAAEDELLPTTLELENETFRLTGTVAEQYEELRKILKKIYFEDLGYDQTPPTRTGEAAPGDS